MEVVKQLKNGKWFIRTVETYDEAEAMFLRLGLMDNCREIWINTGTFSRNLKMACGSDWTDFDVLRAIDMRIQGNIERSRMGGAL